ncbi:DNA repair protein RecN [Ileibacterium valens]|uniref:DNA repair protein RecN n=2 Tax=Ileibacterium valens TaxID=1862668 RepID=UPI002729695A|nr:DNA repair protein RecN [Ileibacterium valens]
MIEQLSVRDYILFDSANINFKNGMSVITGETGAGKSLLIDAIGYLSGERLQGDVVRSGSEKAVLSMVLSDPSKEVISLLEENGFEVDDEIIITRIITPNKKSRMQINLQPATNALVKKVTSMMIDVHSQMDTITLMNPEVQMGLLDQYAKTGTQKEKVEQAYKAYSSVSAELKKLQTETFSDEELDFITEQLNEITNMNIRDGELEELQEKIEDASGASKAREDFSSALYLIRKDNGISDQLYTAARTLKRSSRPEFGEKLSDLYYAIQDVSEEISDAQDSLAAMEEDLDAMQEREYQIKKLYRKYGGDYEGVMAAAEKLNEKVDRILHRQDLFDKLEKEKKESLKTYQKEAKILSKTRQDQFSSLKKRIEEHAHDLMLENCVFEINRKEKAPAKDGIDEIEFLVSMNPGQPLTPLRQSASGGELSRLMLALKVVFQADNGIGTLVFDEIDTGVSGKVALAMGSKMHTLAENYQVLCITHLASVAVWADEHYRVAKSANQQSTKTEVEVLDDETHFEELAIMSNGTASPSAIDSMKDLAREVRVNG